MMIIGYNSPKLFGINNTQAVTAAQTINLGAGTDTLHISDTVASTATLPINDSTFKNVTNPIQ